MRARLRTSLLILTAVIAGGVTAIAPATLSSAQKTITVRKFSVTLAADPRALVDPGVWKFDGRRGHGMYSWSNPKMIELGFGNGEVGGKVVFVAPHEKRLKPGFYPHAGEHPFQDESSPGMRMTWGTYTCENGGWFDIQRIAFSKSGKLKRLAMTFGHHCDGSIRGSYGEVRVGRGAHRKDATVLPSRPQWVPIEVGSRSWVRRVRVVPLRRGVTLEALRLRGPHRTDFSFDRGECATGEALRRRGCTGTVTFAPTSGGPRNAHLHVRTGQRQGALLEGLALPSRSTLTMTKASVPGGGEPKTWSFSSPRGDFFRGSHAPEAGVDAEVITAEDDHWYLTFLVRNGLQAGRRYEVPGPDEEHAYMSITGESDCIEGVGWFEVDDVGVRKNGYGHYFDIDFDYRCEGTAQSLTGAFEFRVPTDETTEPAPVDDLRVRRRGTTAPVKWQASPSSDVAYYLVRYAGRRIHDTLAGYPGYAGPRTSATLRGVPARGNLNVSVYVVDDAGNIGGPTRARRR